MCRPRRVMVIEHAERFGLAQLHQLRGRVGRGADASFCLLLHEEWVNDAARRRLTLLRDTDDGFLIADEDFRLRGGGDLLGTKQSGLPGFRLADPIEHEGLLHMAHRDAAVLLRKRSEADVGARTGGARAAAAVRDGRRRCGRWRRGDVALVPEARTIARRIFRRPERARPALPRLSGCPTDRRMRRRCICRRGAPDGLRPPRLQG